MKKYYKKFWKLHFVLLFIAVIHQTCLIGSFFLIGFIAQSIFDKNAMLFAYYSVASFSLMLLALIFSFMDNVLEAIIVQRTSIMLRSHLINNFAKEEYNSFLKNANGKYFSTLFNDVELWVEKTISTFYDFFNKVLMSIIALGFLFFYSYIIALLIVILTLIIFIVPKLYQKIVDKALKNVLDNNAIFNTTILKNLEGFKTYYHYLKTDIMQNNFLKSFKDNNEIKRKYNIKNVNLEFIADFVLNGAYKLIYISMILLAFFGKNSFIFSLGAIAGITSLQINIFNSLSGLSNDYAALKSSKVLEKNFKQLKIFNSTKRLNTFSNIETISFKNVSLKRQGKTIFKNFSLNIEKGKKYLLIGKNGSGKSSIIKNLLKIENNFQNGIFINGKNIATLEKENIYSNIAFANNKSYLFNGSISQNISLADDFNEESLNGSINLKFIDSFDETYDSSANDYSIGQKERISISSVLYKDKGIIIFDESLSNLDVKNRNFIEDDMLSNSKTFIHVSHNVSESTKSKYDQIINLDNYSTQCVK